MPISVSEEPISFPCAPKQVLAKPPPNIKKSTFLAREEIKDNLVEILAPPRTPTIGLFALSKFSKASSSSLIKNPAQASFTKSTTPTVEA